MNKLVLVSVTLAIGAGSAVAADLPIKAPPTAVVFSWTGLYVGAHVGGVWTRAQQSLFVDPNIGNYIGSINAGAISAAGTFAQNRTGIEGGIQFGYNVQADFFLAGVEADIAFLEGKTPTRVTAIFPPGTGLTGQLFSLTNSIDTTWLATLRLRTGITLDHWLLYVTGGLAIRDRKNDFAFSGPGPALAAFNNSRIVTMGTVGAGIEYAFRNGWSIKAEYLYVGRAIFDVVGQITEPGTPVFQQVSLTQEATLHVARLGVNYRFGAP